MFQKEREKAVLDELQSFKENGTGYLVPRPKDKNIVKSKIVYAHKKNDKGEIIRYKARYVAREIYSNSLF